MNKGLEKIDKTFLKIPDENGEFTICVKKHAIQGETCYFEPNFQLNYAKDKIVRNDIFFDWQDVLGRNSQGFQLSNKTEFEEYCRKKFKDFRENGDLILNPYATDVCKMREPEYPDQEICDLKFHIL